MTNGPISLEKFAWDKERGTLTISASNVDTNEWYRTSPAATMVKSHVTGKEFIFVWNGVQDLRKNPENVTYWILRPEDPQCPISRILLTYRSWPEGLVLREGENDPQTSLG